MADQPPVAVEWRRGAWFATHEACGWKVAACDEDFARTLASVHRCPASVSPAPADPVVSPAERLESLRFFAAESPDGLAKALTDWMQEVERQVSQLRERLNDLPAHATREPIRW